MRFRPREVRHGAQRAMAAGLRPPRPVWLRLTGDDDPRPADGADCLFEPVLEIRAPSNREERISEMRDTLEYVMGSRVWCAGEESGSRTEFGEVEFVVVDPVSDKLTHLVVRADDDGSDGQSRLVPVHIAVPGPDGVELNCTRARFEEFEPALQSYFLPNAEPIGPRGPAGGERVLSWPFYGLSPSPALLGASPGAEPAPATVTVERIPAGEVSVRRGERVHAADGEIGRVKGLVVVPPDSEVSHVLLDEGHLWGRKRVAIPIRDVTGIDENGVAVRLTKDEIKILPPVDVEG